MIRYATMLFFAAIAILAMFISSCGEETKSGKQPYKGDKSTEEKLKAARQDKSKGFLGEFVAKPEWEVLAPHFGAYMKQLEDNLRSRAVTWQYKDSFASRIEKYFPVESTPGKAKLSIAETILKQATKKPAKVVEKKPDPTVQSILDGIIPPEMAKKEEGKPATAEATTADRMTKHPLDKYKFKIILTGLSNPEVVVEDPEGNFMVAYRNSTIGKEGGMITDILKHKVLVRLPDSPEPKVISIAPETLPESFVLRTRR